MSTPDLLQLGQALDAHGFGGREIEIRAMVSDARRSGLDGVAVDVLADQFAPDVARFRAFAVVAVALTKAGRPTASFDRAA